MIKYCSEQKGQGLGNTILKTCDSRGAQTVTWGQESFKRHSEFKKGWVRERFENESIIHFSNIPKKDFSVLMGLL